MKKMLVTCVIEVPDTKTDRIKGILGFVRYHFGKAFTVLSTSCTEVAPK